jgi:tripartite-type tricarboxylate transporter receptor subunit TctC
MKRILTVLAATLIAASASAQGTWPAKPIKLVVPFTAGSGTDIIARTVGDAMSKGLGQPVLPYDTVKDLTGVTPLAALPNANLKAP